MNLSAWPRIQSGMSKPARRTRRKEEVVATRLWDVLEAIHEVTPDEAEARAVFEAILREGRVHVDRSGTWLALAREISLAA